MVLKERVGEVNTQRGGIVYPLTNANENMFELVTFEICNVYIKAMSYCTQPFILACGHGFMVPMEHKWRTQASHTERNDKESNG